MKIEKVKISEVKNNPNNPRVIKNDDFRKLVKSIKDAPWMLELRSIVVNDDNVVLGGNQRLRACKEAGLKEIYITKASELSEEQQREFIVKDNLSSGEWDWDALANEFESEQLKGWGMDLPFNEEDVIEMNNPYNEETENNFATELDRESNYIVLKFDRDIDWLQAKTLFNLKTETARRSNGKAWSSGTGRVLNGVDVINILTKK